MTTVSIDREFVSRGLPLRACSAPRLGLSPRWLLLLLFVVISFAALGVRARMLGRQGTYPTLALVTVVFVVLVAGAHVRRVQVLRSLSTPDYRLVG